MDRRVASSGKRPAVQEDGDGYSGFGHYMMIKEGKIRKQQLEGLIQYSTIFEGVIAYVNGHTDPPQHELKDMIVQHGGRYEQYHRSCVTHMIVTNLPDAKVRQLGPAELVVRPEWIVDSIKHGKRLSIDQYRLYASPLRDHGQSMLKFEAADSAIETETEEPQNHDKLELDNEGQDDADLPHSRRIVDINDPQFLDNYFSSSRLHHLSAWKQDLELFTTKLMEEKGAPRKLSTQVSSVIMHVDMDCFFVSVNMRDHPELADKPVAISHAAGRSVSTASLKNSGSDIASCNYLARELGVRNGMFIRSALRLCPDLVLLPYHFDKYQKVAYDLYRILANYADQMRAVSCDEAYIDVTLLAKDIEPLNLAQKIRSEIKEKCGCTASIGIGSNMLLARLATRKAKPDGQWMLTGNEAMDYLKELPLSDIPGIGSSLRRRLSAHGWHTCGDLRSVSSLRLKNIFGAKLGKTLHDKARGIECRDISERTQRQSVGADVNWAMRFDNSEQAIEFIRKLAHHVYTKQSCLGMVGRKVQLKALQRKSDAESPTKGLGHGACDAFTKTRVIPGGITSDKVLFQECVALYTLLNIPPGELRGMGIFITDLQRNDVGQRNSDISKLLASYAPSCQDPKERLIERLGYNRAIFEELPDSIKEEIIHEALNKQPNERVYLPNPGPIKARPPIAGKGQKPLSFGHKKDNFTVALPLDIDRSVLDALPDEIRAEIYRQYAQHNPNSRKEPGNVPAEDRRAESVLINPNLPSFRNMTKACDIIVWVRNVMATESPGVISESILELSGYLEGLVGSGYCCDFILNVLRGLSLLASEDSHLGAIRGVYDNIQALMLLKYKGPLHLSQK